MSTRSIIKSAYCSMNATHFELIDFGKTVQIFSTASLISSLFVLFFNSFSSLLIMNSQRTQTVSSLTGAGVDGFSGMLTTSWKDGTATTLTMMASSTSKSCVFLEHSESCWQTCLGDNSSESNFTILSVFSLIKSSHNDSYSL